MDAEELLAKAPALALPCLSHAIAGGTAQQSLLMSIAFLFAVWLPPADWSRKQWDEQPGWASHQQQNKCKMPAATHNDDPGPRNRAVRHLQTHASRENSKQVTRLSLVYLCRVR